VKHLFKFLVLAVLAAALWRCALAIPFGSPLAGSPLPPAMDEHYIAAARAETGASNVVTSIVFDYRGFDTLGEASVLFTAVLGVGLVLRKLNAKEKREARDAEE
jgi:multisubunit Na+/H+ antiporter MnhB subunit